MKKILLLTAILFFGSTNPVIYVLPHETSAGAELGASLGQAIGNIAGALAIASEQREIRRRQEQRISQEIYLQRRSIIQQPNLQDLIKQESPKKSKDLLIFIILCIGIIGVIFIRKITKKRK
jgi:hypothetical protein